MPYDHITKSYHAYIDSSRLSSETITDAGVRVGSLKFIDGTVLTPGDPSPVGRTDDGELAYPVFPSVTQMRLERRDIAKLAYAWATSNNITIPLESPLTSGPNTFLLDALLNEALPPVLYQDSSHGKMTRENDIQKLLAGDIDALEYLWREPQITLAGTAD